ncbi:hypothetical protein D3C71_931680 [compost metagenome]
MTEVRDWQKEIELPDYSVMLMRLAKANERAAAEKERADKAERKETKLKEALEHCINQYPLYDSKEIAASLMVDFMKNILSILYPLAVLGEEEAK